MWWNITNCMKRKICSNYKNVLVNCNLMVFSTDYFPSGMLGTIGQLHNLEELTIEAETNVFDTDIQFICKNLTQLKIFNLKDLNNRLSSSALIYLDKLNILERLTVNSVPMDDKTVSKLDLLNSLKGLSVTHSILADIGLSYLSDHRIMKELHLDFTPGITDFAILKISILKHLEILSISGCSITDTGLVHIKKFSMMKDLDVSNCFQISDFGVSHLSSLSYLKKLDVSGCRKLTGQGLCKLNNLLSLRNLEIRSANMTDEDVSFISKLSSLMVLNISNNRISDASVPSISSLMFLHKLNVSLTLMSEYGVLQLRCLLKYLKVCKSVVVRNRMVLVE